MNKYNEIIISNNIGFIKIIDLNNNKYIYINYSNIKKYRINKKKIIISFKDRTVIRIFTDINLFKYTYDCYKNKMYIYNNMYNKSKKNKISINYFIEYKDFLIINDEDTFYLKKASVINYINYIKEKSELNEKL